VHQSAGGGLARAPQHRKVKEEDPAEPLARPSLSPVIPGSCRLLCRLVRAAPRDRSDAGGARAGAVLAAM